MKGQQLIDITGNRYGMLTVLGFSHMAERRRSYWVCRCDCGNIKILRKDTFAYPYSKVVSCGCHHRCESSNRPRDAKTGKYISLEKEKL